MKLHIFIETGVPTTKKENNQYTNEWYFIHQYIKHLRDTISDEDIDIIDVGGKDKLSFFDNQMRDFGKNGDKNLVIFDADFVIDGGGVEKRQNDMKAFKESALVDFDYFFFPNNQDDGVFEDLLLQIINPEHQGIMDCFSHYEQCIGGQNEVKGGNCYETPNIKAKVYTYITTFKRSKKEADKVKKGNWDFGNAAYWNLNHSYLTPLKSFLEKYLLKG